MRISVLRLSKSFKQLVHCVNNRNTGKHVTPSKIVFATFISDEILSYAGHILLVNDNYFKSNEYDFRVLSHETGDDYYPPDRRWNKIKAVSQALQNWARNCTHIVFMDADLVILDVEFNIASTINKYPGANLILAADEIDVANTGFMIVRNTPWSIEFFDRWWTARGSKDTFCDQHVLNKLLENPADRSLVAITPAKELNSKWPAIDNFAESDPVLHLMGETSELRSAVSKYLAEEYCSLIASQHAAPTLQVTKKRLLEIKQQTIVAVWEYSMTRCMSEDANENDFDVLHENIGQRCEPAKRPADASEVYSVCERMLREAILIHRTRLNTLLSSNVDNGIKGTKQGEQRILHLNHLSMLQYDLLELSIARSTIDTQRAASKLVVFEGAQQTLSFLEELEDALDMSVAHNFAYVHHKRGMVFGQLGRYHQTQTHWEAAAETDAVSITELHEALQVTAPHQLEFHAFASSYVHAAMRLAQAFRELKRLDEAEEWISIALINAKLLYAFTSNEERLRTAELREIHLLSLSIYAALQNLEKIALHSHEVNLLL